jgi:hypothetical protein
MQSRKRWVKFRCIAIGTNFLFKIFLIYRLSYIVCKRVELLKGSNSLFPQTNTIFKFRNNGQCQRRCRNVIPGILF